MLTKKEFIQLFTAISSAKSMYPHGGNEGWVHTESILKLLALYTEEKEPPLLSKEGRKISFKFKP